MAKVYDNANDLITFARNSAGTALRRVGYGDELVTNGTFDTDSDWTKSTGWTIDINSGVASANIASGFNDIDQVISVTAGKLYNIELSITSVTSGAISVYLGNSGNGDAEVSGLGNITTPGDYQGSIVFNGSQTQQILIRAQNGFVGSINNVSVKEVFLDRATDPLVLFNHPGGMPRIEYGSDGSLKGLLIEEQRTNLLANSDNPGTQVATLPAGSHTLSFVGGPSVTGIDDTIDEVNAVDVFVYDTSKDTDGGAWRTGSLAKASSWYNETLNTDTRGSRREFPEVAVIVAEENKVTIYDGDDPSLPMWMVFEGGTGNALYNAFVTGVACLNGKLIASLNSAMFSVSFLEDALQIQQTAGTRVFIDPISGRSSGNGYAAHASGGEIVNNTVNDVAMTVLPDAPTDPATGLPVPTIAVATDGGVSVITDSGAVYDSAETLVVTNLEIIGDQFFVNRESTPLVFAQYDLPSISADGFVYARTYRRNDGTLNNYPQIAFSGGAWSLAGGNKKEPNVGHNTGLWKLSQGDIVSVAAYKDLSSKITTSYTTGWMNGNIKLAALADTTAETLSGSELVGSDYTASFSQNADNAFTITASRIEISGYVGGVPYVYTNANILEEGKTYLLSFEVVSVTGNGYFAGPINGQVSGFLSLGVGTHSFFVRPTATGRLQINAGGDFALEAISVKQADPDRIVNGNGLIVNGTITKTAVATGADVVGYEFGGDNANYLLLADGDAINPGAGDFCFLCWYYNTGIGSTQYLFEAETTAGSFFVARNSTSVPTVNLYGSLYDGAVAGSVSTSENTPEDTWLNVAMVRRDGALYLYVNGVEKSVDLTSDGDMTGLIERVRIANRSTLDRAFYGRLALMRFSATAPTADQITKIYNDEKVLFQPNAKATLTGSSDAVTALAHDPDTDLLHVGTSGGRSVFYGLRRVNETATAVTTAISAVDGLIVEQ